MKWIDSHRRIDKAVTVGKNSSKKIEVLCLFRRPRECFLQVSGNTLQLVETYLGVLVFTSDESRNKEIDTRIGKANSVLREPYCSVATKRELSKNTKLLKKQTAEMGFRCDTS